MKSDISGENLLQGKAQPHPLFHVKQKTGRACPLPVFPFLKAIPHKERLATLHAICLQIFRHIA